MFGWFKKATPISALGKQAVEVIVDDRDRGEIIVTWIVGEDVDEETYARFKDEDGRLHVLTRYKDGTKEAYVTTKEKYKQAFELSESWMSPEAVRDRAEAGNALAQVGLGHLYLEGKGVPQDAVEAAKWFLKAAEQGDGDAQLSLGYIYFEGLGVSRDNVLAYKWFSLAEISDNDLATEGRRAAVEQMTPDQIAEAEKLIMEWKPTVQPQS